MEVAEHQDLVLVFLSPVLLQSANFESQTSIDCKLVLSIDVNSVLGRGALSHLNVGHPVRRLA